MRRLIAVAVVAAALAVASLPDRKQAIERGLHFIYQVAKDRKNLNDFGEDLMWCFYSIGTTSRDPELAREALAMGRERAAVWIKQNATLTANANASNIEDRVFGAWAAEQLGFPNAQLKAQLRQAAARYTARDFLAWDPAHEPPPSDVPKACGRCKRTNPRGATVCRHCGANLILRSRYDMWYDALIAIYSGDHYGVTLGATYKDVIRWLPTMRPYRGREGGRNPDFVDTVYAVTHVVYTLNDYSKYRLLPEWLPQEFAYLKASMNEAVALRDPETMGEFLDTLKAFGLTDDDPLIRSGIDYVLSTQNKDGSWGPLQSDDMYDRYHPTWTAIDGLRDYNWTLRKPEYIWPVVK